MGGDDPSGRGSSPHTRGALVFAYPTSIQDGDHPRIRGEHHAASLVSQSIHGSSPHTRGAPSVEGRLDARAGIIPAYAGSTAVAEMAQWRWWDHPRIRGEHDVYDMVTARGRGSSPHTRGARLQLSNDHLVHGIIPAYAGSTGHDRLGRPRGKDHPRIRGEHQQNYSKLFTSPGSSPHTRGARPRCVHCPRSLRIIPAYAGSTGRRTARPRPESDHPRIRGEHQ